MTRPNSATDNSGTDDSIVDGPTADEPIADDPIADGPARGDAGTFVLVAGGAAIDPATVADLPASATVIAADSGLDRARALGWEVDVAVGDMDSVSASALAAAEAAGTELVCHRPDKDETDLEIALALAVERGATRIIVVGADGGRFDHLLANAFVLAAPWLAAVQVEARFDATVVRVVRDSLTVVGQPGDLVSLLPVHGAAHGVVTEGLRYPLRAETLEPGSPRGMSNVLDGATAGVSLRDGVLLVITPPATESDPQNQPAPPAERGNR